MRERFIHLQFTLDIIKRLKHSVMSFQRQGKQYSDDMRLTVINKHKNGLGSKKIAKELDMPLSSVKTILQKYKKNRQTMIAPRYGRPRVTNEYDDREIRREVMKNRRVSAETLQRSFLTLYDKEISLETFRRRIRDWGLNGRVTIKKPFISKANREKRLKFALEHQFLTSDDWMRLLFTDESPFNLHGSNRKVYLWRRPGEEFKDECLAPTFKSGHDSVMVWGAINYNGVGTLRFCEGTMNSCDCIDLLLDELPNNCAQLELPVDFIFQQDNALIQNAKKVLNFLDENAVTTLEHPPQSPELNPIEHVWALIGLRIRDCPPTSKEGLKRRIYRLWDEIPLDFIQKLIKSMPNRLADVIAAKGGSTKY
ncbi:hypothetical protein AeRB84_020477 [Aphanomyces euteiches]|nr:hypothetical protein AeRB84_020477 [Aphanomyces euteiches]